MAPRNQSNSSRQSTESSKRNAKGASGNTSKRQSSSSLPASQPNNKAKSAESSASESRDGSRNDSTSRAAEEVESNQKPCVTLKEFSARAQELKDDIKIILDKHHNPTDSEEQPSEIVHLRESILELSRPELGDEDSLGTSATKPQDEDTKASSEPSGSATEIETNGSRSSHIKDTSETVPSSNLSKSDIIEPNEIMREESNEQSDTNNPASAKLVDASVQTTNGRHPDRAAEILAKINSDPSLNNFFELLAAKLDSDSKFMALSSSLKKHFESTPDVINPICWKLVHLSEQNTRLSVDCQHLQIENEKLSMMKQKLSDLCRELQRSNNSIRIESLDLIKQEQSKAKEQTTKIQSTLSSVIKLFDENQQRNMSLRQENVDLHNKLRALLEHCNHWEKSVETAMKQRDLESKLLKTELAKLNLIRNEEKDIFLGEKKDLLHVLSLMQAQQHKIEGQEAQLRSDLSNYANRYDECRAVVNQGMSKFQEESKRMLKQLEKSRADYVTLLKKYEKMTRSLTSLMEDKDRLSKALGVANKKNETLEKLCRALRTENQDKGSNDDFIRTKKNKDSVALEEKDGNQINVETDGNKISELLPSNV